MIFLNLRFPRDDFPPVVFRRRRVKCSRVHRCSSAQITKRRHRKCTANFICRHVLSLSLSLGDARLTIIVSLAKHIRHRPHSGSAKIRRAHKGRLTSADAELLRFSSARVTPSAPVFSRFPRVPAKGFFVTAPKFIQLCCASVIRTILEIHSPYAFIHELRAILQVRVMIPRRSPGLF